MTDCITGIVFIQIVRPIGPVGGREFTAVTVGIITTPVVFAAIGGTTIRIAGAAGTTAMVFPDIHGDTGGLCQHIERA